MLKEDFQIEVGKILKMRRHHPRKSKYPKIEVPEKTTDQCRRQKFLGHILNISRIISWVCLKLENIVQIACDYDRIFVV